MTAASTVAVALAAGLDRAVAEPPSRVHPVAWFGNLVEPVDREWTHPRTVGVVAAVGLPFVAAVAGAGAVLGGYRAGAAVSPSAGLALATLAATVVLFVSTSLRMLVDTASEVSGLADADLETAREELLSLAGRDAADLPAGLVRSAAVESTAENLADGLIAPLFAFALGTAVAGAVFGVSSITALAAGAGVAAWVKGVNTLDSMLGYRAKPVGWASARLDDAVMWFPARLSAALIALAAATASETLTATASETLTATASGTLAAARRDARVPASPNSGWPMATLAHALDVRLEKRGAYVLNGDASVPDDDDADRGIRIVNRAGWLGAALAGVIAAV